MLIAIVIRLKTYRFHGQNKHATMEGVPRPRSRSPINDAFNSMCAKCRLGCRVIDTPKCNAIDATSPPRRAVMEAQPTHDAIQAQPRPSCPIAYRQAPPGLLTGSRPTDSKSCPMAPATCRRGSVASRPYASTNRLPGTGALSSWAPISRQTGRGSSSSSAYVSRSPGRKWATMEDVPLSVEPVPADLMRWAVTKPIHCTHQPAFSATRRRRIPRRL
jgi:hypothetical protein